MAVRVGSARIDERGKAIGGKAGNQTGRELSEQNWYKHSKGWRVFRAKDPAKAGAIARDMRYAIANKHIGYDQGERNTLYNVAKTVGFDCSKVTKNCETDCSALVRVCCAYAGITGLPADFRTGNMPANLMATGAFDELKGSKYTDSSAYLKAGDILVTKTAGHTVVVLTNGSKADADTGYTETGDIVVTLSLLKKGSKGHEVAAAQSILKAQGYNLGSYGIDGDFGSATFEAVKEFQRNNHLTIDGEIGQNTWNKLLKG